MRSVAITLTMNVLVCLLIGGCIGVALVATEFVGASLHPTGFLAERKHTRYDPELGWVNIPSLEIENLYGPGLSFRTNDRGFRNRMEFADAVPPGTVRVVCSGDSFTLGFGVSDEETWCHQLALPGIELERVNMGQGGYGLHQAYLWYMRDGRKLEHQILVFAFIGEDFVRMRATRFFGYGTPRLRRGGAGILEVTNAPVSRAAHRFPWLAQNSLYFRRVSAVVDRLLGGSSGDLLPWDEVYETSHQIFDDLVRVQRSTGGDTIFVYLPTLTDLEGPVGVREEVGRHLTKKGYRFLDLTGPMGEVSAGRRVGFFLWDEVTFPAATGHYSRRGNRFVARRISRVLEQHPIVRAAISRSAASAP